MKNSLLNNLWLCLGLLFCSAQADAQNLSNRGTEFWVGYGHHQFMETGANTQEMVLYFSAEQAANVTVTINGTAYVRNYAVPANSVIPSELIPKVGFIDARLSTIPCTFALPAEPCNSVGTFTRQAIKIVSDVPIVAYAHIYGSQSSGATMLMPVETWGYTYYTINSKQSYQADCFSWMYVIAQEDNTVVEITPSQDTRFDGVGTNLAGVPFLVTLNKGEIYQTMAGPESGSTKLEFTGTKVRSIANATGQCYPIAVFSGSSRTYNTPVSCGASSGGDNDNQQCFPTQAWGKRYLLAPTSASTSSSVFHFNTYKIVVKDPSTQVFRNGTLLGGMNPAGYYEFNSNQAELITSDQPIMVAQFIHSGNGCLVAGVGDPEMIYVSPIEQGTNRIGFYRNVQQNITVNYLTLVIPNGGVSSLRINSLPVWDHSYIHPRDPNYTVVVKRWTADDVQATAQSDSAFTAITYGLGSVESYGYNAGTLINNLAGISELHNQPDPTRPSHPYTCINTPIELSVLLPYEPTFMEWKLSELSTVLSPSVNVIDNAPVSSGTTTINGVTYYRFTLPGTYTFSQAGTHTVKIVNTHSSIDNCNNTEEIRIQFEVRNPPQTDFTISTTGCGLDPVDFDAPATSPDGSILVSYAWDFGGGATATGQTASHTFSTAGTYPVTLTVVSEAGCIADSIMDVTVGSAPVAAFTVSDNDICEGVTVTLTDATTFAGVDHWYWDFGDGNILNAPNNNPITHTYATAGTYTVKYAVGAGPTCLGDTTTATITVRANPLPVMGYPNGCLPANGIINFTNSSTVPDGRNITAYAWDFGDPAATPGNPNTSTLATPSHTYSSFGTYTISLTVTTQDGCTATITESPTFNLAPVVSYPALTAVCQNNAPVSIATATVTNGVPGSGVYSGPGTSSAGMFDPAVAGAGTHTVSYVYTTTGGCVETVNNSILVHAAPVVDFDIAAGTCLPANGQVQFVNNTTIADAQTMTWAWNFDDPNATGPNPNTSTAQNPTHIYQDGSYDIELTATTNNGCSNSAIITKVLSVTPALSFPALAAACESTTTPVSIALATVTNGVPGTGVYSGPGTTAAGMFDPSAAGPGTHTITYDFTSGAGCTTTATSTILVRAKPTVSFTNDAVGCLASTGLVNFTNTSTISDAQTMTWAWDFDDAASTPGNPNTSTVQNPSHNFGEGTYDIKLVATTNNGCVAEATIPSTFAVTPALAYPALTAVCQDAATVYVATATVTNGVTGTGVYSGAGTTAAGMFDPSVAGAGTHNITYEFTSAGGCVETIVSTILVHAQPTVSFTNDAVGCLATTGLVNFTNTTTISDGQTMTWAWDFDDAASTPGNPNTSTVQNPSHNFGEGTYDIKLVATTNNGCVAEATIPSTFAVTPALAYPALTAVCQDAATVSVATATVTNGVTGTGVYSGAGTTAAGMFDPSVAGAGTHNITYEFTSAGGCVETIVSTILVHAQPTVSFTNDAVGCLATTGLVNFTNTTTISDGQTMTWAWDFDDVASTPGNPNTSTVQNPSHNFGEGTYDIKLVATTNNGCVAEAIIPATFAVTPALAYPALTAVCQDAATVSVATATVTNGVTGTGVYSGAGTTAAGMFDPSVVGAGTHNITYEFTSAGGCVETIVSTILVHAQPTVSFTNDAVGCLASTGLVNFTNTTTIGDGQTMTWAWDFDDAVSTPGNPNTSTVQNPSHNFGEGTYDIKLVATTNNGCVAEAIIPTTFAVTPALDYPALAPICEDAAALSVATATVTNGVTGTGIYSGAGTTAAGIFDPAVAGGGSHTITYTFTSTGGCVETITQTIFVNPKPVSSFTATMNVCLGQVVTITNTSTISTGTIATWKWFLGDGTTDVRADGTAFTHTYAAFGSYTIKLVTESAIGCTSDTAYVTVNVHAIPVVDFTSPAFICMPGGVAAFVNNSSTPDGATITYNWNFGDGGTSTGMNPTHIYSNVGPFDVTLTGTTQYGCVNSSTQNLSVFYDQPIANFTVAPDVLCQGVPNVFTDNSTAPGSTISSWNWQFGDGGTSTVEDPSHLYTNAGNYTASLVVQNQFGCTSEPYTSPIVVNFQPIIDAGRSFEVPLGATVQLQPTSNDFSITSFLWTPQGDISNTSEFNPTFVALQNVTYILTATSNGGCTAQDSTFVLVQRSLKIPNVFSPNGDGINDRWEITNMHDYPRAVIQVFNRYGQKLYEAKGNAQPWDGTYQGKPLPLATYYYVIDLKNGFDVLTGSLTIIK